MTGSELACWPVTKIVAGTCWATSQLTMSRPVPVVSRSKVRAMSLPPAGPCFTSRPVPSAGAVGAGGIDGAIGGGGLAV